MDVIFGHREVGERQHTCIDSSCRVDVNRSHGDARDCTPLRCCRDSDDDSRRAGGSRAGGGSASVGGSSASIGGSSAGGRNAGILLIVRFGSLHMWYKVRAGRDVHHLVLGCVVANRKAMHAFPDGGIIIASRGAPCGSDLSIDHHHPCACKRGARESKGGW